MAGDLIELPVSERHFVKYTFLKIESRLAAADARAARAGQARVPRGLRGLRRRPSAAVLLARRHPRGRGAAADLRGREPRSHPRVPRRARPERPDAAGRRRRTRSWGCARARSTPKTCARRRAAFAASTCSSTRSSSRASGTRCRPRSAGGSCRATSTVGREYPGVDNHTTYSFGLDDQEFVVAFDTDDVGTFLDLVQRLRTTEASRYTVRDTPSFTCLAVSLPRALNALDGEPRRARGATRAALCLKRAPSARPRARVRDPAGSRTCAARPGARRRDRRRRPQAARRARRATRGPLRRAGARDRRPAALDQGRAQHLPAPDRALRRAHPDARGGARGRARRAARRRRPLAREGRLPALAGRARRSRASSSSSAWTSCPTSR